jgi:hypothetical protein
MLFSFSSILALTFMVHYAAATKVLRICCIHIQRSHSRIHM